MLRTIWFFIWLFFYLLWCLPARIRVVWLNYRGRYVEKEALAQKVRDNWGAKALKHSGVTLVVKGQENLPPAGVRAVFVANHQSFLDIPVVLAGLGRPFPLMAKHVMRRIPFIRGWMKTLDCVIVKPGDLSMQASAMRKSRDLLEADHALLIFPEGRRSESREMLPFQPAAFSLACRTGAPVVPMAIDGCHRTFDCNRWRIRRVVVTLNILPPIDTKNLSAAQRRALPRQTADVIKACLEETEHRAALPDSA